MSVDDSVRIDVDGKNIASLTRKQVVSIDVRFEDKAYGPGIHTWAWRDGRWEVFPESSRPPHHPRCTGRHEGDGACIISDIYGGT